MTDITPTVGRLVLYTFGESQVPALVVGEKEGAINLYVFPNGNNHDPFFTSDVWKGTEDGQWDWMPFQKDQQARLAVGSMTNNETVAAGLAPAPTGVPTAPQETVEATLITDWLDHKSGDVVEVTAAKKADLVAQGHVAAE